MMDAVSMPGLVCALLLPWLLGAVLVFNMLRPTGRWNYFIVAGHGYLVGIFLTTIIMRLWQLLGMPWHFWGIAGTMATLTALGLLVLHRQVSPDRQLQKSPPMQTWQWLVSALLLGLIIMRYTSIAQELALRPLFPWDAWMNWAPKAITWLHYNDMVPFVSREEWLRAPAAALNYTEGAGNAWKYPITVPLIQLWNMLGLGTSDHTLIYLPWLFIALAMGSALYGHLRQSGASALLATLAAYALLNLPFINVHVVLAGYADIWVAAVFGCAVFALHEWGKNRQWPYAILALVLAVMCTQLKIPGLIMGGIVVLVFLTSVVRINRLALLVLGVVALLVCVVILTGGIDFHVAGMGRVAVSSDGIILPYIGQYKLEYHAVHKAMANTMFFMLNWYMLWYLFLFVSLFWLMKRRERGVSRYIPSLELRALVLTLLFIFFVYYFTNRYVFVLDYTQINRALIYVIPLMVFYLFSRPSMAAN